MKIHIIDGRIIANPEHLAMIQAFYSRSHISIIDRLEELGQSEEEIEAKLKLYYVGYGHSAIGDCANTLVSFENVSILAAKVIQDDQLYNGTETSTRFMDFSENMPISPIQSLDTLQEESMEFYSKIKKDLLQHFIQTENPSNDKEVKALSAKTFDIVRSLLPAGVRTKLSWNTSLRKVYERLAELHYHPLEEVRELASITLAEAIEKYPNSVTNIRYSDSKIDYLNKYATKLHYSFNDKQICDQLQKHDDYYACSASIDEFDYLSLEEYLDLLNDIPDDCEIPKALSGPFEFRFYFFLDYGSFRDIQRHRNGLVRLPIHCIDYGFHQWYLNSFPVHLRDRVIHHLAHVEHILKSYSDSNVKSDFDKAQLQYYVPLGYRVPVSLVYRLPEAVYVARLRSSSTVHPTLRDIAIRMIDSIKKIVPRIHFKYEETEDYLKRATQDIIKIK